MASMLPASRARVAVGLFTLALVACGSKAKDPRYPARADGCAVKSFAGEPTMAVDDLGVVEIDCDGSAKCGRKLLDEVCRAGGDVVWGLGENSLTSMKMRGHAAHVANKGFAPRSAGCDVKVFADAPSTPTENIGPVSATCAQETSDADCMRTLKDQVCELGGDVVWGVAPPVAAGNKKVLSGRASHSR
jgi:hypothetical protein